MNTHSTRYFRNTVITILVIMLSGQTLFAPLQAQEIDEEPALIEHEFIPYGIAGETQEFFARVIDNLGISTVILNYKIADKESFESIEMYSSNGQDYSATVEDATSPGDLLRYYIVVEDNSGNRSQKGFLFDPLERSMVTAEQAALEEPANTQTQSSLKWWHIALGVLAVGAIAGAAGGSGGSSAANSECPNTGCSLTVSLPTPQ